VLRADFSERDSALATPSSVAHAIGADNGSCSGGVWATLGNFLYSTREVVPDYKGFPYTNRQPYAAATLSGGGKYLVLDAGEGFTYAVTFKSASQTSNATGSAPKTTATVKVPTGFGDGSATIVLKAETNPSRTSTATLVLGSGQSTASHGAKPKPKPKKLKKKQRR
jgi:hypothetical protein